MGKWKLQRGSSWQSNWIEADNGERDVLKFISATPHEQAKALFAPEMYEALKDLEEFLLGSEYFKTGLNVQRLLAKIDAEGPL